MVRKWGWVATILFFAVPALRAERVTVAQLEQILAASHTLPDSEFAARLSDLQLTERLSPVQRAHWLSALPGARTQRAFLGLADRSAFLDLPGAEILPTPAPDIPEQRRILSLTATYVSKAIPQLPHFYASRAIIHYEGEPGSTNGPEQGGPLHAMKISRTTIEYSDGQEIVQPGPVKTSKTRTSETGLKTWGAFGPVLGLVLVDAAENKLGWSHWEQGANGPLAVFHYSVPRERSHYEVRYCCIASSYGMENNSFHVMTGYHGEIAVDPATGIIVRLTLQAELKPGDGDPISRADIAVEYGPVELGGVTYICPQHSVSISLARTVRESQDPSGHSFPVMGPEQMLLNHVDFDQYHLFRGETRILSGAEERTAGLAPDATLPPATVPVDVAPSEEELADVPAPTAPKPNPAPPPAAPSNADTQEISTAEATALPDSPERSSDQPEPTPTDVRFHISARLVDVNVVVLDKKGRPIPDLKPEDFEIYDNGVPQKVSSFSRANAESAPAPPPPPVSGDQGTFSNRASSSAAPPAAEPNTIVLLVDASNLAQSDFADVRQQLLKFLQSAPPNQRVALYAMRYHTYEVLEEATTDHQRIAARLARWMPNAQDMNNAWDEEDRNRQKMDYVHSPEDMLSVNGNYTMDTGTQTEALDPQLRELGSQPGPIAMGLLTQVAHHLAGIPGHKSLVWVTSDNVLADWTKASITIEKGSKYIEPVALRTQEAMNNAHVSVYPLDASRLEGGAITADVQTRNIELTPTFQRPLAYEKMQEGPESGSGQDMNPYIQNRNYGTGGRLMAQMEQDMHPIQGVFREVADATGGRTFARSNNMVGELSSVAAEANSTYLLGFSPGQPADGKYHLLTVKLAGRKDVTLRYRSGYNYDKEPPNLKERFGELIWQPNDAGDIGLTARPVADAAGKALRVTVKGADLDLFHPSA